MATYFTYEATQSSTPSVGDKGKNSRGQTVYYNGDKWVSQSTWLASQGGPEITNTQTNDVTGEKTTFKYTNDGVYVNGDKTDMAGATTARDQIQADEWIAKIRDLGGDATWDGTYYHITDAQGNKYKVNSPVGDTWASIRAAAGLPPTTQNPWYEGDDGPGGIPGPLTVTPEYPDGGPQPGGGMGPIGNNPFDPGTNPGTGPTLPGGGTPGGGSMFDGYGPPEGVPLNPIVKQNEMVFSPYGNPAARFSDTLTYGGLPRSTGPWGVMGGYYGGFPENYANPPEGYTPPNPGNWGSSPGNISPGGNIASNPIPGTTLPPNPWDPATPLNWGSGGSGGSDGSGGATDPKNPPVISPTEPGPTGPGVSIQPPPPGNTTKPPSETPYRPYGMTPAEYQALQTYYTVNGLNGTGQVK
jgi:hypothetical protein